MNINKIISNIFKSYFLLDPNFIYTKSYEKWPQIVNCTKHSRFVYITLHGSKEVEASKGISQILKANVSKPVVLSPGIDGLTYLNNTNRTCCDPDSTPSRIHPPICIHDIRISRHQLIKTDASLKNSCIRK